MKLTLSRIANYLERSMRYQSFFFLFWLSKNWYYKCPGYFFTANQMYFLDQFYEIELISVFDVCLPCQCLTLINRFQFCKKYKCTVYRVKYKCTVATSSVQAAVRCTVDIEVFSSSFAYYQDFRCHCLKQKMVKKKYLWS